MNPRTLVSAALLAVSMLAAGVLLGRSTQHDPPGRTPGAEHSARPDETGDCPDGSAARHWRAPMDPTFVRDSPGKSPMGMDLVPVCPSAEAGVEIERGLVQSTSIRTESAVRTNLSQPIRAAGRVTFDERKVVHVHPKVQGWVERLYVDSPGDAVVKGQPLLELYSPELVATQEELLLASRYRASTEASDFEDVRAGGRTLLDASRRRLELWDVPKREIDRLLETGEITRTLTIDAQSSGVVTHLAVRAGMEVAPSQNLYTIADLSTVWVIADVYEHELPWIEEGQTSVFELDAIAGRRFEGRIEYVAPFLDPTTRTAQIRIELDNEDGRLKPEMFGRVTIDASVREDVVAVHAAAVLRSGRRDVVFVETAPGRFVPRTVETGLESGDGMIEIISGLAVGERVVVSGQFMIDSESKLDEAIRNLGAEADAAPAAHEGH